MDIDIYQTCPCQSGKKIKFCCARDILPELGQVVSLHQGKQSVAALEKITRLIDKHGAKACLLGLQVHILLFLKEYEQAIQANEKFLAAFPRNPLGHQHAAQLHAASGHSTEAIDSLQDALDACGNNGVPVTMANAFRTVGMMLMSQGHVVAGRAHLVFASQVKEGADEVVSQLIMQTFRSPEIPLLLKSEFPVFVPDEDHSAAWTDKYVNATAFAGVGRWRAARTLALQLLSEFPDVPEIVQAAAIWSMYLADQSTASDLFQSYAALDAVDFDRAVEAMATRMAIDPQPLTDAWDFVRSTFALHDVDKFQEQAIASHRLVNGTIFSQGFVDYDAPPPVAAYLLLDRDEIRQYADIGDEPFPQVIAELLVFGKQTDRDARIEFFSVRDESFDAVLDQFRELAGDVIDGQPEEEVVEQISMLDYKMSIRWHLPADTPLESRQEFVTRQKQTEYLEILPTIPFQVLGNQSFEDAGDDPDTLKKIATLVLLMEQGADGAAAEAFDFDQLRQKYSVPVPQPIDLQKRDFDSLSPVEMQRIDFQQLPDETLIKAYILGSSCGNLQVIRLSGPVILSRPEMEKFVRFEMVYVMMARLAADTDEALELMQKARTHATNANRPIGNLLIDELELRLERNRPEGCQELLRVLQAHHLQDPQNQYRLAAVLQRFGIMGPDGRMKTAPGEPAEPVAAATGNEIWTPDAGPSGGEGESGNSGLWLPD